MKFTCKRDHRLTNLTDAARRRRCGPVPLQETLAKSDTQEHRLLASVVLSFLLLSLQPLLSMRGTLRLGSSFGRGVGSKEVLFILYLYN